MFVAVLLVGSALAAVVFHHVARVRADDAETHEAAGPGAEADRAGGRAR